MILKVEFQSVNKIINVGSSNRLPTWKDFHSSVVKNFPPLKGASYIVKNEVGTEVDRNLFLHSVKPKKKFIITLEEGHAYNEPESGASNDSKYLNPYLIGLGAAVGVIGAMTAPEIVKEVGLTAAEVAVSALVEKMSFDVSEVDALMDAWKLSEPDGSICPCGCHPRVNWCRYFEGCCTERAKADAECQVRK